MRQEVNNCLIYILCNLSHWVHRVYTYNTKKNIQCSLIICGFKILGTLKERIYRKLRGPPVLWKKITANIFYFFLRATGLLAIFHKQWRDNQKVRIKILGLSVQFYLCNSFFFQIDLRRNKFFIYMSEQPK
jgi:hypothetical protein